MLLAELTPEQCAVEIVSVVPQVVRFLRSQMRQGDASLSLSQLRVLNYLKRYPQVSLTDVSEYLDVTRATMSATIERLVQRGLVERTEDPQERRRVILSLTPTGEQQLQQVLQRTRNQVAQKLDNFSDEQLQQLLQGLWLLRQAFEEADL
ncbi:MAG: MarR family transcriptional regulator [Desertifilum sp. SIO1I2]|nr:MarR family transcriptional regulator [Desertifilum sp. SIO1I2]